MVKTSVMAEGVAYDVLDRVRKGKKVSMRQIIPKHGYSKGIADQPHRVKQTKAYQAVINPVVKRWENIRDKMTKQLENRDLSAEETTDLVSMVDKLTHNIQLLSGNSTENVAVVNVTEQYNELINKVKAEQ